MDAKLTELTEAEQVYVAMTGCCAGCGHMLGYHFDHLVTYDHMVDGKPSSCWYHGCVCLVINRLDYHVA